MATLSFEVATEGVPDGRTTFFGYWGLPNSGFNPVQLSDADGDGVYTASVQRPKGETLVTEIVKGAGTRRTALGTEPGEPTETLRARETIKLDEDTTLSASYAFSGGGDPGDDPPGEHPPSGTGAMTGGGMTARGRWMAKMAGTDRRADGLTGRLHLWRTITRSDGSLSPGRHFLSSVETLGV